MTKLFLVRHAETEANLKGLWYGSTDAPLTERGEKQVLATGQRMAELVQEHPLDAFYVSPLGRTQKTAAAITEQIRPKNYGSVGKPIQSSDRRTESQSSVFINGPSRSSKF